MMLGAYTLPSAIERGTKPEALGYKPCHGTSTEDLKTSERMAYS